MGGVIVKRAGDYKAYRIGAGDTNYMACIFDPIAEGVPFTSIVEIYEPGGKTPPNSHAIAYEMFFILKGTAIAHAGGESVALGPGDSILLKPNESHVIENTGAGKLYALCTMIPNEEFAELIHGGTPVPLGADDIAVLTGAA